MKAWKKKVALSWLLFQMQSAAAVADTGSATPTSFHSTAGLTHSQKPEKSDMVFMSLFREINPNQGGSWERRQWEMGEETCSLRKKEKECLLR